MAKLEASSGGTGLQIKDLPPPNQYVAVCLRVNDLFDQERADFNNPKETVIKDVTRFIFGVKDQQGRCYLVQTFEFTISGAPGSNLIKFLKAWLGQDPQMGWDYSEMKNRGALITVQHKASASNPGQIYANISGIAPVFQQLSHLVPNPAEFEPMLQALERQAAQPTAPATTPVSRPPGAGYPTPPAAPPPPPPALVPPAPGATSVPPPQLSPDGKWQLVNNQWVPYPSPTPAAAASPSPGSFNPPAGPNDDVPF